MPDKCPPLLNLCFAPPDDLAHIRSRYAARIAGTASRSYAPPRIPNLTRSFCDPRVALSYLRGLDLVCRKIVTKQNACVSQISTLSSEPTSATCLLQLEAAMDIAACMHS